MQSCDPDDEKSYTKQYQIHEPSSFCYYIKCFDDEVYDPKLVSYTREDAAQKFVEMLEGDIREYCCAINGSVVSATIDRSHCALGRWVWGSQD